MKPKIKFNGLLWVIEYDLDTISEYLILANHFAYELNLKQNRYKEFL